jgi:hypothetical protein
MPDSDRQVTEVAVIKTAYEHRREKAIHISTDRQEGREERSVIQTAGIVHKKWMASHRRYVNTSNHLAALEQ